MKIMKMTLMVSSVNKINMARNRISVHPFGYSKQNRASVLGKNYSKDSRNPTQTIKFKKAYTVPVVKDGKFVYHYETINGKKVKVLTKETFYNSFTKTIKHSSANRPSKGRTLAQMVMQTYEQA